MWTSDKKCVRIAYNFGPTGFGRGGVIQAVALWSDPNMLISQCVAGEVSCCSVDTG